MAKNINYINQHSDALQYARHYGDFAGVDLTSDQSLVAPNRFAAAKNVWRDWQSQNGACVETIPGYRKIRDFDGDEINGLFKWGDVYIFHHGTDITIAEDLDNASGDVTLSNVLENRKSKGVAVDGAFFFLDGTNYKRLTYGNGEYSIEDASNVAYVPVTYSDGAKYEQRNILSEKAIERFTISDPDRFKVEAPVFTTASVTGGLSITGVQSPVENVVIPTEIDGSAVVAIAANAFKDDGYIKTLVIPHTVTTIGDYAFYNCPGLWLVSICKDSAEGGDYGITSIGQYAFANCDSLKTLCLPVSSAGNGATIEKGAFSNADSSKHIETLILKGRFARISNSAFWKRSIFSNNSNDDRITSNDDRGLVFYNTDTTASKNVIEALFSGNSDSPQEAGGILEASFVDASSENCNQLSITAPENPAHSSGNNKVSLNNVRYAYRGSEMKLANDNAGENVYSEDEASVLFCVDTSDHIRGPDGQNVAAGYIFENRFSGSAFAKFALGGNGGNGDSYNCNISISTGGVTVATLSPGAEGAVKYCRTGGWGIKIKTTYYNSYFCSYTVEVTVTVEDAKAFRGNLKIVGYSRDESSAPTPVGYNSKLECQITHIYPVIDNNPVHYKFPLKEETTEIGTVKIDGVDISSSGTYGVAKKVLGKDSYVGFSQSDLDDIITDKTLDVEITLGFSEDEEEEKDGEYLKFAGDKTAIEKCTLAAYYDGRLFLAGNPEHPNIVFHSHGTLAGKNSPLYFGEYDYFKDGQDDVPITALLSTGSMLMVFKDVSDDRSGIYYHTGSSTDSDLVPRIYPSTQGAAGVGSLGAAFNFIDEPVFISKRGLDGVGLQAVNLERSVWHRSYTIDRKLSKENLQNAMLAEWCGYLCVFCGSNIYLADSRQKFKRGDEVNFEWYVIEGVGDYADKEPVYFTVDDPNFALRHYVDGEPEALPLYGGTPEPNDGTSDYPGQIKEGSIYVGNDHFKLYAANERKAVPYDAVASGSAYDGIDGETALIDENGDAILVYYYADEDASDGKYAGEGRYLLDSEGEWVGTGQISPPTAVMSFNDRLVFGTALGTVFCFNNDLRGFYDEDGEWRDEIPRNAYSFDGRRYTSEVVTASDNCGIPHLNKSTCKHSVVLKYKRFSQGDFKVLCRADLGAWQHFRLVSSKLDFGDLFFGNLAFRGADAGVSVVGERLRKWHEKQYRIISDGYKAPFGIYSLTYRYRNGGRIEQ